MAEKQFISLENLRYFKTRQDTFNDDKFATKESVPTKTSQLENDSEYQTKTQLDTAINAAIAAVMTYKGVKATASELPMEDNKLGDVWHVTADTAEYAWDGTKWEVLGSTMDVSVAWNDITGKPSEFTPSEHTHVVDDITDLDLSKYANYTFDSEHVIQIPMDMGTTGMSLKPGVYLMVEGTELPDELKTWKESVGFEGSISGYLHVFEYMNGEYPDHLLMYQVDMRSADGTQHAGSMWVFEGVTKKWAQPLATIDSISGLREAINTTKYVHPDAKELTAGLYKFATNAQGHVIEGTAVTKNDITALGIPAQDTTYDLATVEADGLMASTDKVKLDGLDNVIPVENTDIDGLF